METLTTCASSAFAPIIPAVQANNPTLRGHLASGKVFFGEASRYALYAVHTRFEAVMWFVADAETTCPETGLPAIVRQESDPSKAIAGLA